MLSWPLHQWPFVMVAFGETFVSFGVALCCRRPLSVVHVTEHHAACQDSKMSVDSPYES